MDSFLPTSQLRMLLAVAGGALLIAIVIGLSVRDLPPRRALLIAAVAFGVSCAAGALFVWNR